MVARSVEVLKLQRTRLSHLDSSILYCQSSILVLKISQFTNLLTLISLKSGFDRILYGTSSLADKAVDLLVRATPPANDVAFRPVLEWCFRPRRLLSHRLYSQPPTYPQMGCIYSQRRRSIWVSRSSSVAVRQRIARGREAMRVRRCKGSGSNAGQAMHTAAQTLVTQQLLRTGGTVRRGHIKHRNKEPVRACLHTWNSHNMPQILPCQITPSLSSFGHSRWRK